MKAAVIGYGRIGKIHYKNLDANSSVEVVAVADPFISDEDKAYLEANGTSVYAEYQDAIVDGLDVVFVCSASDTHVDVSLLAISKGINVFCEKPVDKDINRVKEVIEALKDSDVKFQVGFNRRFDHNFAEIKKTIDAGKVGDIHQIKIVSRDPEAPPVEYVKVSGGIFNDMSIHDLDMMRYFSDSEVETVYAIGSCLVNPDIANYDDVDTAVITFKFKNGSTGVIENSRQAVYGYDQRAEVFGSKGAVSIENDQNSTVKLSTKDAIVTEKPLYFFLERYMESFKTEVDAFIKCIEEDTNTIVDITDGFMSMILAVAAKRSLETGMPVNIDELVKEYYEKGL